MRIPLILAGLSLTTFVGGAAFGAATTDTVRGGVPTRVAVAPTPTPLPPPPVPLVSSAPELAPCANEDGPGPCVWLADQMGNGKGLSFWIDSDQCFHYFKAKADRRLGGCLGNKSA